MTAAATATAIGARAERAARLYLERAGLEALSLNYRCRTGEIDLVMRDGETVVFVEVRYRRAARHGTGAESVDARKRARLVSAARHFLHRHPHWAEAPCRFDVVSMSPSPRGARVRWIRRAFDARDAAGSGS